MTGVVLVGAGFVSVGAGSAVAMAAAARALDPAHFATFVTWWTFANLLGLLFAVVEGYLPRLLLTTRSEGNDETPVLATYTYGVIGGTSTLAVVVLASASWLVPTLLGGSVTLLALAVAYVGTLAMQSLQRAVSASRESFSGFTVQLGLDGLLRGAGAVLLAAGGATSAATFAALLCGAAAAGVVAATATSGRWLVLRRPLAATPLRPLAILSLASMSPLLTNNAGVPWLSGVGDVRPEAVGSVAGALTLSRLPTLLVGAAYAPLLAPLARAVVARRRADFEALHQRARCGVVLGALVFVAAFTFLGPWLLPVFLGSSYQLAAWKLAAMAGGSGFMFICVVEQAAVIALSAFSWVAAGWGLALISFVLVLSGPGDPVSRVAVAVLLSPVIAAVVMSRGRAVTARKTFATEPGPTGEG